MAYVINGTFIYSTGSPVASKVISFSPAFETPVVADSGSLIVSSTIQVETDTDGEMSPVTLLEGIYDVTIDGVNNFQIDVPPSGSGDIGDILYTAP